MPTVFVYGALMRNPLVCQRGRAARVVDHAVRFVAVGVPGLEPRFAALVASPGDEAWGVVATLSDAEWRRISAHEITYDRVQVDLVEPVDGHASALALVLARCHQGCEAPPSRRYGRLLAQGARENGLPDEVVERYRDLAERGPTLTDRVPAATALIRAYGRLLHRLGRG